MLTPKDPTAFTDAMADLLRLPDETLAMAYIYLHKYNRHFETSNTPSPLDPYTLALTTLSLAAKTTESPRPPSAILLPAHSLLHPALPPLTPASPTYPPLRRTLLAAELLLLRVLGFECRLPSPMDHIQRYLARALDEIMNAGLSSSTRGGGGGGGASRDADAMVDYTRWSRAEREESGVVPLAETGLGREARRWGIRACKSAAVVGFWPSRAVGLGAVWMAGRERGLGLGLGEEGDAGEWVRRVGGGKVDVGEWREVVGILGGV